jgi:hypothetical protein
LEDRVPSSDLNVLFVDDIESYRRNGYLVPTLRLSGGDLDKLQRLALRFIADNPNAKGGLRGPHLANGISSQSAESQAGWLSIITRPELLDIIEQLIGPDIILWTSTLFYKPPLEEATPWHRDGCPFLSQTKSEETITAWIAVFDVERENGALRVIPGSHIFQPWHAPDSHDQHRAGSVILSDVEERAAVDVELEAGQLIIFDVSTVHGSWPNRSSRARAGFAVRYFPATSYFDRSSVAGFARGRELILVRGQDRAGNTFEPLVDTVHTCNVSAGSA